MSEHAQTTGALGDQREIAHLLAYRSSRVSYRHEDGDLQNSRGAEFKGTSLIHFADRGDWARSSFCTAICLVAGPPGPGRGILGLRPSGPGPVGSGDGPGPVPSADPRPTGFDPRTSESDRPDRSGHPRADPVGRRAPGKNLKTRSDPDRSP
jgi:hypothetical protein